MSLAKRTHSPAWLLAALVALLACLGMQRCFVFCDSATCGGIKWLHCSACDDFELGQADERAATCESGCCEERTQASEGHGSEPTARAIPCCKEHPLPLEEWLPTERVTAPTPLAIATGIVPWLASPPTETRKSRRVVCATGPPRVPRLVELLATSVLLI